MGSAFVWGAVAASSLVIGGLVGAFVNVGQRALGLIMGFGAGVLISATAYELVFEAVQLGGLTGFPAIGFFSGAFTFFAADLAIARRSLRSGAQQEPAGGGSLVGPLVLGATLDGIPESVVLGLGILEGGSVSVAMLVAVFISNVPEGLAGAASMRTIGWSTAKILGTWALIVLVCGTASAAGYALLGSASDRLLSVVQAFAGGAILMMLANSMIPEAYERAGRLAGVATVTGFAIAVFLVVLEHSGS